MKFGVPKEYLAEGIDPEVKAAFMEVLKTLTELGAIVEFFSVKTMEYMIPAYYIIASAEASSNLERFDGVKYGYRAKEYEGLHDMYKRSRTEGFGEEVKRRIMLGSFVLSSGYYDAYYLKALRTKALIKQEFNQAFEKYDVSSCPGSALYSAKDRRKPEGSAGYVSGRYLYSCSQPVRTAWDYRSLRQGRTQGCLSAYR